MSHICVFKIPLSEESIMASYLFILKEKVGYSQTQVYSIMYYR